MPASARRTSPIRPLVGVNVAADRVGVHHRTIRRWIADGRLPAYRIGAKLIKVDVADVDALIRPVPTAGNGA